MNVLEAIKMRRSVRAYASTPIPEEVLERMYQAMRFAPSARNFQPWRFIFVTDAELRRRIAQGADERPFIAEAPLIVVGCGLPEQAYKSMGGYGNSAEIDVAIALDHLTLAGVAEGLGTCWIGGFDEQQVKRLLEVPPNAKVVALTPLEYPASVDLFAPVRDEDRKSPSEIFATDRF